MESWMFDALIYCKILYKMNQNIIKVANMKCIKAYSDAGEIFGEICDQMSILIPIKSDFNEKKVKIQNTDGILLLKEEINFIEKDINDLILKYERELYRIKIVRNKREHELHKIQPNSSGNGSKELLYIRFAYDEEKYLLRCEEFIKIVKDLNQIFQKIITIIKEGYKNKNECNLYIEDMTDIDYMIFNKIYQSNVLRECSSAMQKPL